jgi:hypothetical protein
MDFLDPSKSPILQGAKNFAGGLSTGLKQGYDKGAKDVEDLGKFLTPGILKTIEVVANVSQKFADKFGISPVTAAMIVGIAATAPAALPAYVVALALRRVATNLANKMYDTAWEKLTGKTVEELDKMWVDWKSKNPTAATPKVVADSFDSFNSFLRVSIVSYASFNSSSIPSRAILTVPAEPAANFCSKDLESPKSSLLNSFMLSITFSAGSSF